MIDKYLKLLFNNLPSVFTTEEACFYLKARYKAPLKALSSMEKSGVIIRLRRGLYASSELFDPLKAASRVYGPSYISYETALAYYGLIPERVRHVISVVDGRPASFASQQVQFVYHSQKRKLFAEGMSMIFIGNEAVPIASPEKALLDTLGIQNLSTEALADSEIIDFVCDSLRVDFDDLKHLSLRKMRTMAKMYRNHAPRKLVNGLALVRSGNR